jgi:hypothetical protein
MSDDVRMLIIGTEKSTWSGRVPTKVADEIERLRAELAEKDRRIKHLEIAVEIKALGLRECQDAVAGRNCRIEELERVVAVSAKFLRNQGVWDE